MSIEKHSIFDYDYGIGEKKYSPYENVSTDKPPIYAIADKQYKFLPIVCVRLFGSSEANGGKGKLTSTYTERQLHKATIPQTHDDILRIKLQALHASVKLWDMTIHYKNGRKQLVQLPDIIYQNGESKLIDLKEQGGIESITFSLNAVTFSEQAPVLWIWGT